MLHLLRIELKKMTYYRTFWILMGLYLFSLIVTINGSINFIDWIGNKAVMNDVNLDVDNSSLYHFPNIWQNMAYLGGFFKIILGFVVVISISNEFIYRTSRQNIIDGMSREQFIGSKILSNLLLSLISTGIIFFITLFLGVAYHPKATITAIFLDSEIMFSYFLEVFTFLSFALLLGMGIQKTGLAIVLLIVSPIIEFIITGLSGYGEWIKHYLPMKAMSNLVTPPFSEFTFSEWQSKPTVYPFIIALVWAILFNGIGYLRLKKLDL